MKRLLFLLLMLAIIYGCGDDKTVNEQGVQTAPSAASVMPTMPDPATAELSPAAVPTADFTVSPGLSGTDKTLFTFDATLSQGTIDKYKWSFGDKTYAKGLLVTHKFKYGGTYTVKLTAVSDTKDKDRLTKAITIDGPPPPDGGGGGGGGGGTDGSCKLNDFRINPFTVGSVSGTRVTIDKSFRSCNACGEIRRRAPGILEFGGDLVDINGRVLTLDYGSLPEKTRPKPGETMYLIWKPLSERPHCTS